MSLRSSILKQASKNTIGAGLRESFFQSAFRTLPTDGLAGTNRAAIQDALGKSGAIDKTVFSSRLGKMSDDSVNDALVIMAKDSPAEFDVLMRNMYADDTGGRTALKKFYKENPSIQSNIKKALPDDTAFFKGIDGSVKELSESQIKNLGAAQGITRAGFAAADGGKKFFTKVWDSIASGRALNTTRFGITVGVAWIVIDVLASLTGQTKLEFFSDLFEFIKDPSASLFADDDGDGINGSWKLTSLGQMVFGMVALFGIAVAVKLIKTLKPSEA